MNSTLQKTVLAGIVGTAAMTIVTFMAPMMGMPKMSVPGMLSGMTGLPIAIGWVMHFMIGTSFALGYTYFFSSKLKIENLFVKGAVFGIIVFVFAQIMIPLIGMVMGSIPPPEGGMMAMIMGALIGHVVYGIPVALIAKPQQ